jgi:outer membrane receptor protein involved in Fe transport
MEGFLTIPHIEQKLTKQTRMKKFIKLLMLTLIIPITISSSYAQETGTVIGKIVDVTSGEELIGVNIFLEGTSLGAASDLTGSFSIRAVPAGAYTLIASMVGYSKLSVTGVNVKPGETVKFDLTLAPESVETEEVIVTARMLENNEASLLKLRQRSNSISDAISEELITRSGSSNAADAMTKVTGASVVGGKYVFVRGLGERYSSTHLNGVELPSADPDKKSFNMDLLPTGVLENIVTVKSFTPDKPGNFSGGIVDIGTKSYPDKFTLKLSLGTQYNSVATFNENFLTYSGSSTDWFGMDDGSRDIPAIVADPNTVIPPVSSARLDDEQAAFLDEVSKSFEPEMSPKSKTAPINQNYSLSIGDQFELFNIPVGFIGSYTYNRDFTFYENGTSGRWKLTGDVNTIESLAELQYLNDSQGTDEVNWGGLVSLNLKPHTRHEIGANFVYTQSGQSLTRYLNGRWLEQFNDSPNIILQTRVLSYTERSLQSYQIHGKHVFDDLLGLGINWSGSIASTTQDEPDVRYFTNHVNNETLNYSISRSNYPLPARYWRNMDEDSKGVLLDLSLPVKVWDNQQAKFKFGGAFNEKERDFTERRFEYQLGEVSQGAPRYEGDADFFFSNENVGILRYDSTRSRYVFANTISDTPDPRGGNYNGYEKVSAIYAMLELPILRSLRFIGGARYEITKMDVYGKDQKGFLDDKDLLPSLNLIYQLSENMNIRTSYGKTLARPNFREKAPYANFNFAADFIFIGNPDLQRTLIDNYDLRWEWFLRPGEIIAVSGFYKYLKNPIERVINVLFVSEGGEVFYDNIDKANVYGVEIEARKRLDEVSGILSNFSLGANLTVIESVVSIPEGELAVIRDLDPNAEATRQLQGQSPFILNLELGYDNLNSGTNVSLFYNVFGDRLAEISIGGTPDVFERSRPMLDLTFSQIILSNFSMRVAVKNLLNSPYRLTHEFKGAEYVRTEFTTGTSLSIGLGYNF